MGFQKGNKLGKGRPKGSPNKTTDIVKSVYAEALTESTDKLLTELNALSGGEYIKAYIAISKFILPTLQSKTVEAVVTAGMPTWIDKLDKLDAISEDDLDNLLEE